MIIAASFFAGRILVWAQVWSPPNSTPPVNNAGQPPTVSNVTGFLRKSPVVTQTLKGLVTGAKVSSVPVQLANPEGKNSSIIARKSFAVVPTSRFPSGTSGIFGYATGTDYGLYAIAEGTGTNYALQGKVDTAGYAGRFQGPLSIATNGLAVGSLQVEGLLAADVEKGITCVESDCPGTIAYQATNSVGGYGLYSYSSVRPGIELNLNAIPGYAAQGLSTAIEESYGIGGMGIIGVHGIAQGSDTADIYRGVYGQNLTANAPEALRGRKGVYGLTNGGLGNNPPGYSSGSQYDFAAGVRACVKDSAGTVLNSNGIYGTGGKYAGYFDGAVSCTSPTMAIVDTSLKGLYNSIATSSDNGFPIVSHIYQFGNKLRFSKCGNAACSSGNTSSTLDTSSDVQYTSLAVGRDGYPVIAFYDIASRQLKVAHCNTVTCLTNGVPDVIISLIYNVGSSNALGLSIKVPDDGIGDPVISFGMGSQRNLYVTKCGNPSCSNVFSTTLVDPASKVGDYNSLVIPSDGRPVISYWDENNNALKIAKCGNPSCSSGNTITPDVDTQGGWDTSIAIASDGYPIIAYSVVGTLRVVKCGNPFCSSGNTFTDLSTGVGYPSIAVPPDERPVISFYKTIPQEIKMVKCGDSSCSSGNLITTLGAPEGPHNNITIGGDGYPVISVFGGFGETPSDDNLKVYKCNNASCTPSCIPEPSGNGGILMIAGNEQNGGLGAVLRIGNTYLTKNNLKGLLCKADLGSC